MTGQLTLRCCGQSGCEICAEARGELLPCENGCNVCRREVEPEPATSEPAIPQEYMVYCEICSKPLMEFTTDADQRTRRGECCPEVYAWRHWAGHGTRPELRDRQQPAAEIRIPMVPHVEGNQLRSGILPQYRELEGVDGEMYEEAYPSCRNCGESEWEIHYDEDADGNAPAAVNNLDWEDGDGARVYFPNENPEHSIDHANCRNCGWILERIDYALC